MRNPDLLNTGEDIYANNEKTILEIKSVDDFDNLQYNLLDDKEFKKYIEDIKRCVRTSFEYRQLIKYLKNTEGMNRCSFMDNVEYVPGGKVKIELHHEPFTLYDIALAVFKKRQRNKEDTRVQCVAEEIMYLHYIGAVGLVSLSSTIHKMVHNQFLFVPTNIVRGDYNVFKNMYYNDIEPETLDYLDAAEIASRDEELVKKQMEILNNHSIYINANDSYNLLTRGDMVSIIKNRINTIKGTMPLLAKIVN